MKETKYTEIHTRAQDGKPLAMAYYVLAEDGPDGLRYYGVKIEECNSGESAQISDLTTETNRIYTLVDKLAKNSVTPTGLADVVADWL